MYVHFTTREGDPEPEPPVDYWVVSRDMGFLSGEARLVVTEAEIEPGDQKLAGPFTDPGLGWAWITANS